MKAFKKSAQNIYRLLTLVALKHQWRTFDPLNNQHSLTGHAKTARRSWPYLVYSALNSPTLNRSDERHRDLFLLSIKTC